ncbi:sucrase ferredoxin [Vacuolonema iberomarrocanum]|uniref:sucrase ferredoxin n=1 Tax=Vacuolonema iberomarrocanum TaxID=3454632 RepID=UPI0019DDB8AE|nr:sucrase ferredoxin [filamentous cyanobacterium LEGE 07170]
MQIIDVDDVADCRYCSDVSKANGEDPIGSAPKVDHWILVEVPLPWPSTLFTESPLTKQITPIVKKLIFKRGIMVRPLAIAPDPEYSQPGHTRVIYYYRPAQQFAEYTKQEYVVPSDQTSPLVMALLNTLLNRTKEIDQFAPYQQDTTALREILVCTHTQVDLACGRYGTPIYRELRKTYGQPGQPLRVWQSVHFGGHRLAPTLVDLPTGQLWGHLEADVLPQLIHRSGDPHEMRRFYRGWTGASKFEQIAEREAWMQAGWDWFTYPRTTQITRKGLAGRKRWLYPVLRRVPIQPLQLWLDRWTSGASWVDVEVTYRAPQGSGCYQARVEENGEVMSAGKSAAKPNEKIKLTPMKQYRISQFKQAD